MPASALAFSMFSSGLPTSMRLVGHAGSLNEFTDEELLVAHRDGESDAMRYLIRRYKDELIGYLTKFMGSRALAEDVFQDTFLQVHISAEKFDASRRFRPWLYTIATNKGRDAHRKRVRRPVGSLSIAISEDGRTEISDLIQGKVDVPEQEQMAREQRQALSGVLEVIPENFREIILLCYFQRMKYQQVAEILGIPLGTVKSRLHSAIVFLAKEYKEQFGSSKEDEKPSPKE